MSVNSLQKNAPKEDEIRRMKRQAEICKFIKENKRKHVSENKIVLQIKKVGLGTRDTVRSELTRMQNSEMIKIETGRTGQGHRISINDKSELIWIQDELSKIEKVIEKMGYRPRHNSEMLDFKPLWKFLEIYTIVSVMLGILLSTINKLPDSRDFPKLRLHATVFELTEKLTIKFEDVQTPKQFLKSMIFLDDENLDPQLKNIVKNFIKTIPTKK